jgi:hypothetical protein
LVVVVGGCWWLLVVVGLKKEFRKGCCVFGFDQKRLGIPIGVGKPRDDQSRARGVWFGWRRKDSSQATPSFGASHGRVLGKVCTWCQQALR